VYSALSTALNGETDTKFEPVSPSLDSDSDL